MSLHIIRKELNIPLLSPATIKETCKLCTSLRQSTVLDAAANA